MSTCFSNYCSLRVQLLKVRFMSKSPNEELAFPCAPGRRILSVDTWSGLLCALGIKERYCWNEKQMLVRNSPDCSRFFFFFHAWVSSAAKLYLLLSPCIVSYSLTHTTPEAILKSVWWQLPLLGQQGDFSLVLQLPIAGHGDTPPIWCQRRRERMRKRRFSWDRGPLFLFPRCGICCHAWIRGLPR